jgi:hypothetical protein
MAHCVRALALAGRSLQSIRPRFHWTGNAKNVNGTMRGITTHPHCTTFDRGHVLPRACRALTTQSGAGATVGDAGVVDLRSDTVTTPTPALRAAMAAAVVGDDVYDEVGYNVMSTSTACPTASHVLPRIHHRSDFDIGLQIILLPSPTDTCVRALWEPCSLEQDPTVTLFQDTVAALAGKDCALFVPSGTMGNLVSLAKERAPSATTHPSICTASA